MRRSPNSTARFFCALRGGRASVHPAGCACCGPRCCSFSISIRSERQLVERLEFDLLFRWFVGLTIDEKVFDASTFSKNRDRLLTHEIAQGFLRFASQPSGG